MRAYCPIYSFVYQYKFTAAGDNDNKTRRVCETVRFSILQHVISSRCFQFFFFFMVFGVSSNE